MGVLTIMKFGFFVVSAISLILALGWILAFCPGRKFFLLDSVLRCFGYQGHLLRQDFIRNWVDNVNRPAVTAYAVDKYILLAAVAQRNYRSWIDELFYDGTRLQQFSLNFVPAKQSLCTYVLFIELDGAENAAFAYVCYPVKIVFATQWSLTSWHSQLYNCFIWEVVKALLVRKYHLMPTRLFAKDDRTLHDRTNSDRTSIWN